MNIRFLVTGLLLFVSSLSLAQNSALKVTRDTVKVTGEFQINNATKAVSGYLYNARNGSVSFVKAGMDLQFKVGTAGFPQPGDSVYTNPALSNMPLKIWRNTVFQYVDSANGFLYTPASGRILFHPYLSSGDRIYIEGLQAVTFVSDGTSGEGSATTPLPQPIHAGAWDNGNNTFTLRWTTNDKTLTTSPRMLGLGGSTLYGTGATPPGRLRDLIQSFLDNHATSPTWIDLAVYGYSTDSVMPTNEGGRAEHNIDSALRANPDFIFVALPSNDATSGNSIAKWMANLRHLNQLAWARGVPIFFETTQPRTSATPSQQTEIKQVADSIRKAWPDRYVEGFSSVVDKTATTDAVILGTYDSGDGTHMNNTGVKFIGDSLAARLLKYFVPVTTVVNYAIDTSQDGATWKPLETITDPNIVKKTYNRASTIPLYFRVKATYKDGTVSDYSTATLNQRIDQEAPGHSDDPTTDHRILVDIGGDGVSTRDGTGALAGKLSASPDEFGHFWNNWTGPTTGAGFQSGASIASLKTTANESTGISMTFIGTPEGSFGTSSTHSLNFNGFNVAVGDYPKEAVMDNVFFNNSVNTLYPGTGVILRIKGLSKTNVYSFRLWGCRVDDATTTPRTVEAKLGTDAWTASKTFDSHYRSTDAPDFNRAIVFSGLTGVDSLDLDLRIASGATFGHVSVVDIGIGGALPVIAGVTLRDTSITAVAGTNKASVDINPVVALPAGVTVTSAAWTMVSGPSTPTIGIPTATHSLISNLTNGVYTFQLAVQFSNNTQQTGIMKVSVFPPADSRKILRLHFSRTPQFIPGWMNVNGDPATVRTTKTDAITNWSVDNLGPGPVSSPNWLPFGGVSSSDTLGQSTGSNSGIVPDIALKGYWFNYLIKDTVGHKNLVISGLNNTKTYSLQFVASRSSLNATAPRSGVYFVNDGAEQHLDAFTNTANAISLTGIHPDSSGNINIGVYSSNTTNTYGPYSLLSTLIIIEEN